MCADSRSVLKQLRQSISPDDYLVGHSLHYDLRGLNLQHECARLAPPAPQHARLPATFTRACTRALVCHRTSAHMLLHDNDAKCYLDVNGPYLNGVS